METTEQKQLLSKHAYNILNFIKYLQWSPILQNARGGERVCDFGCGDGGLLELEYRNRTAIGSYIGMDTNPSIIEANSSKWKQLPWATFIVADLSSGSDDYSTFSNIGADTVVALNVPDTISRINFYYYMQNFYMCGNPDATYYILLPKSTDLITAQDIDKFITTYFTVVNKFGVLGSTEDFKPVMNDWQIKMYEGLTPYYSPELLSGFMSPFFPEHCQQNLWVLKRKSITNI